MTVLDHTHDAARSSWVESARGHAHYPIQNLPLCIFSHGEEAPRGGVVIGEMILDLARLATFSGLDDAHRELVGIAAGNTLNAYMALPSSDRRKLRHLLFDLLDTATDDDTIRALRPMLVPSSEARFATPATVGDFTDFFAGIHHARKAGKMFRPDNPLLPNYKHVPIGYHARSSTIRISGTPVKRPSGQRLRPGTQEPEVGPTRRLDFELELAMWIGSGNPDGNPIPIGEAGEHLAGLGLLNDWSARDIQAWETQPLGPLLGKNFLTSISPFIVSVEALAPFRTAQPPRPDGDPQPQRYLMDEGDQATGAFDIHLTVAILTPAMRQRGDAPFVVTRSSALDLYWTPAQMIAHHSANGCELRPGDLFGTGTVSANAPDGYGSLGELTSGGSNPLALPGGETRTFLEDGDEVVMTAWCSREGFAAIGLGEVCGTVTSGAQLPA